MRKRLLPVALCFASFLAANECYSNEIDYSKLQAPVQTTTFATDTGWCWYEDPRAIIKNGKLIVGGISGRSGDVRVSVFDLKTNKIDGEVVLHEKLQRDDHNSPVFYARPDGSILAIYAKHGREKIHHYRISDPKDYLKWGEPQQYNHTFAIPESKKKNKGVTYMNLYTAKDEGKLYNFYRQGETFNPFFITSTDNGKTWGNETHFLTHDIGGTQRPYARYLQRDENTIGVSFTDGHPRQVGNSLYYADYRNGAFYKADGTKIKDLKDGALRTGEAEKIYKGSGINEWKGGYHSVKDAAWTAAIAKDRQNNPHIGYTVYRTNDDHDYRVASWDGTKWSDRKIAFGGKCLFPRENSYTGLLVFDTMNPKRVYISTDVNPSTGEFSGSKHEIYTAEIESTDDVKTIKWQKLTTNSKYRNIRPIFAAGEGYKVVLWLGNKPWTKFWDYKSDGVGIVVERP